MKTFDKNKRLVSILLTIYIIVSVLIGLSTFDYLKPEFVSYNVLIAIYAIFGIVTALILYNFAKNKATIVNDTKHDYDIISERETKEKEEKERKKKDEQLRKHKEDEQKRIATEKVSEIADSLVDEVYPEHYFDQLLINISKTINIVQGVAYLINRNDNKFGIQSTYAYYTTDTSRKFEIGEGIPGQVAKDKKYLMLDNVPDNYINIVSGLGNSSPQNLIVFPIVYDDETIAVLELASFEKPTINLDEFYTQFNKKVSKKISELLK